jgi:hypothetical protein
VSDVGGSHRTLTFRNGRRIIADAGGSHRTFRNGRLIVLDVRGSHRTFRNGRGIVSDAGGSHRLFRNGRRIVSDVGGSHRTFRNGRRIVSYRPFGVYHVPKRQFLVSESLNSGIKSSFVGSTYQKDNFWSVEPKVDKEVLFSRPS